MSVKLLKCYGFCGEKHFKENLVKVGSKNFCKPCATKKEKEINDRDTLYKTIQTIYNIPYPTGMMLRQIKQFSEERNYTLEGMTKTLCYFVKIMKKKPFLNGGLSFLPYYYDNAIKYYNDLDERRKNVKDEGIKTTHLVIKPKTVDVFSYRNKKIIDMGGLLSDG